MKINRNIFYVVISILAITSFYSCSSGRESDLKKITELEKKYGSSAFVDTAKANELIRTYDDFVNKYPEDSATARFLFEAGRLSMYTAKGANAISYFDKLIASFPDNRKVPDCMFLKGFVYDDILNDVVKAKDSYRAFIYKYPTHEFADDAKACIDNLGKTPEQLVREFEAKNKVDSIQAKK